MIFRKNIFYNLPTVLEASHDFLCSEDVFLFSNNFSSWWLILSSRPQLSQFNFKWTVLEQSQWITSALIAPENQIKYKKFCLKIPFDPQNQLKITFSSKHIRTGPWAIKFVISQVDDVTSQFRFLNFRSHASISTPLAVNSHLDLFCLISHNLQFSFSATRSIHREPCVTSAR